MFNINVRSKAKLEENIDGSQPTINSLKILMGI